MPEAATNTATDSTTTADPAASNDSTLLGTDGEATNTESNAANTDTLLGSEKPAEPQQPDVPIEYTDFQMPEGFELQGDDAKMLKELGAQFKMPQEAVQKLVDMGVQMQQRQIAAHQKQVQSWQSAAKSDPEYGGEKLEATLLTAESALTLPRGDKLSKILVNSGLGNHPDVIGFMAEVGSLKAKYEKLLQPDNMAHGNGANTTSVSAASVWYDKT